MAMRIVKRWNSEAAVGVDDFGGGPYERAHVPGAPYATNVAVADSDRVGDRMRRVQG